MATATGNRIVAEHFRIVKNQKSIASRHKISDPVLDFILLTDRNRSAVVVESYYRNLVVAIQDGVHLKDLVASGRLREFPFPSEINDRADITGYTHAPDISVMG